jgi:alpha/beta superfamily hydrolase
MTQEHIAGPAGILEVVHESPDGTPQAIAVICHPHPLHGGTLNNKVVHQLARTFLQLGAVSVRFNFRGVGASQGGYDEGRGERLDLHAVADWANERWPGLELWLGGFSFGAFVAIEAVRDLRPTRLVTVAPAVRFLPDADIEVPVADWLVIQGDADEVVPCTAVRAWLGRLPHPPSLVVLNGAGHFFHGRLNDLKQALLDHFSAG